MVATGILEYTIAVALVFCRVSGFLVISPIPGAWVPKEARATLALALGLTIGVLLGPPRAQLTFGLDLVLVAAREATVGLMIGGAFRLVIIAAEFMASLVSQASWLSAPSSMNPDFGGQTQATAQIAILLALLLALATGTHRTVLAYLIESFRILPVGSEMNLGAAIPSFLALVGRSFDVGMSLALPVLGVSLAVQAALALVSRVAPNLQIFSIGFAVLVASGLITFMASLPSMAEGMIGYFQVLPGFLDDLLMRLSEA